MQRKHTPDECRWLEHLAEVGAKDSLRVPTGTCSFRINRYRVSRRTMARISRSDWLSSSAKRCWPLSKATPARFIARSLARTVGRVLTASEDKTARLWEAESGKLLATFQGCFEAHGS